MRVDRPVAFAFLYTNPAGNISFGPVRNISRTTKADWRNVGPYGDMLIYADDEVSYMVNVIRFAQEKDFHWFPGHGFPSPVPEPGAYAMMAPGLAAIGLGAARRRRTGDQA